MKRNMTLLRSHVGVELWHIESYDGCSHVHRITQELCP